MIRTFFILAVLLAATPAAAADLWAAHRVQGSTLIIDADAIETRPDGILRTWVYVVPDGEMPVYRHLDIFDCARGRAGTVKLELNVLGDSGLQTPENRNPAMSRPEDGSGPARVLAFVCAAAADRAAFGFKAPTNDLRQIQAQMRLIPPPPPRPLPTPPAGEPAELPATGKQPRTPAS
ncbi:MAG: hypothetical protein U1E50_08295 [Caulobacteraceae bacterium]